MKCQILFIKKSKKNITNLSSAESAHSMVSVNKSSLRFIYVFLLYLSHHKKTLNSGQQLQHL